jgi:hypothetical protein
MYATVPEAAQAATDLYHLEVAANADLPDSNDTTSRGASGAFHGAIDLELTVVAPLGAPVLTRLTSEPYVRISAQTPARPAAATYELDAIAAITNMSHRQWRLSTGVTLVTTPDVTLALPDLSAAEGFDPSWALPSDVPRDVTVTVRDKPAALGDGTITHFAAHSTRMRPRD